MLPHSESSSPTAVGSSPNSSHPSLTLVGGERRRRCHEIIVIDTEYDPVLEQNQMSKLKYGASSQEIFVSTEVQRRLAESAYVATDLGDLTVKVSLSYK